MVSDNISIWARSDDAGMNLSIASGRWAASAASRIWVSGPTEFSPALQAFLGDVTTLHADIVLSTALAFDFASASLCAGIHRKAQGPPARSCSHCFALSRFAFQSYATTSAIKKSDKFTVAVLFRCRSRHSQQTGSS